MPGGSTVINGDTSDATDINTPLSDIVSDLNAARPVVAGGTGATTASGARTNLGLGDAATKGVTGADSSAVTGTAGTDGNLVSWNADGDAVDSTIDPDTLATLTGTETLTNKTLTAPEINGAVSGDSLATQAEAEAGTNNDQIMTPLRTSQAITALETVPTTSNVLTALSGLTAGDVGTVAMLRNKTGSTVNEGNTATGANLVWSDAGDFDSGSSPSGTWRALGRNRTGYAGLWIRIS